MRLLFTLAVGVMAMCGTAGVPSLDPVSRMQSGWWRDRHADRLACAKKGPHPVVFLGDSITHNWESLGLRAWNSYFARPPYAALNLGFGGDRTEHVLWRITEGGELDGFEAKAVVLMIGTNNNGHRGEKEETTIDTLLGVRAILREVRARQPKAVIVLHPIFPRGKTKDDPVRRRNARVNKELRKLADGRSVIWCDFNDRLLTADGRLAHEMASDALHPGLWGYEIWASELLPILNGILRGDGYLVPGRFAASIAADDVNLGQDSESASVSRVNGEKYVDSDAWLDRLEADRRRIGAVTGTVDVVDLALPGDSAQNVIWRALNGQLDGFRTKKVVLPAGLPTAAVNRLARIAAEKQPQAELVVPDAERFFANPVVAGDWPDPSVFAGGDGWTYSVATGLKTVRRSRDLVVWDDLGVDPLEPAARQACAKFAPEIWAPCVVRLGGRWVMYVSLYKSDADCRICALTADAPQGPYRLAGTVIDGARAGIGTCIDPYVVEDNGRVWMFFGSLGDGIHRAELAADGLGLRPGRNIHQVAGRRNADNRMKGCWEGSYVVRRGAWWYLFVSGGSWGNASYYLTVGRADDIGNAFFDRAGNDLRDGLAEPILSSVPGERFYGPGHCGELVTALGGRTYHFFHAHDAKAANPSERALFLQEVRWTADGWPTYADARTALYEAAFRPASAGFAAVTLEGTNDVQVAAAREFADYYRRMSGAELPIEVGGSRPGVLHLRRGERVGAELTAAGELVVTGTRDNDELFAVRRLLERRFGVRWFKAATDEDPGDYVPASLPVLDRPFRDDYTPRFPIRRLDVTGPRPKVSPVRERLFLDRLGFDLRPPIGGGSSSVCSAVPQALFAEHPEYFALVDGKRVKGERLCYSNPAVAELLLKSVLSAYEKSGGRGMFWFGQRDIVPGRCECAACQAMDGSEDEHRGNASTRFVKLVSSVAPAVYAKYPEADLVVWAHSSYRKPPVGFRPDPRLKIWLFPHGRCYGHALNDPKCGRNRIFNEWLTGWRDVSPNVFVYNHLTCTPLQYACCEEVEAKDIAYYDRLGLLGWKNEVWFPDPKEVFASDWQWLHMTATLLREPWRKGDEVIAEAERLYYGPAAEPMAKYQALRRRLWRESDTCLGYPDDDPRRPSLLSKPGAKERLLASLDEAERLASDDPVFASRVALDRRWLGKYWIEPNEALRALEAKAIAVTSAPWEEAVVFTNFWRGGYRPLEPLPPALGTEVRLRREGGELVVRAVALEPDVGRLVIGPDDEPAWKDDGIELMLMAPGKPNEILHAVVNPKGKTYAVLRPENRPVTFGLKAAGAVGDGRYEVEIRVPLAALGDPSAGLWRFVVGRNRLIRDALTPNGAHVSCNACYFHDIKNYLALRFE